MRALIQRVAKASVTINGGETREIGKGILILLGVKDTDTVDMCPKMAEKCAGLRIFDDEKGMLNLSAQDLGYSALVVSNFTLYGDAKKGKRPSFTQAAKPPLSVDCYDEFVKCIKQMGLKDVQTGDYGADMQINLINDGPVTLMVEL